MKKIKLNLVMIAIIFGTIGAFAFKAPKTNTTAQINHYWFEYDASGDLVYPTTEPTLQPTNPFGCPDAGFTPCCIGSVSVQKVGSVYEPAGVETPDVNKP